MTWFFFICPVLVLHVYENKKKITDVAFDPSDLSLYDLYVFMSATKFSENHKEKKNTLNCDKIIHFFFFFFCCKPKQPVKFSYK